MRAPPSRPLVSGYWSCLTLKFLSNQLNFVFSDCSLTPSFSWGWSRHLCVISACWESSPTIFLDINKTVSEFLGAVLIPIDCRRQADPFNPVKGLWYLQPVHLLQMYFSNSRSLSLSSWLFHLHLFCSLLNAFSWWILLSVHAIVPTPIRCYQ